MTNLARQFDEQHVYGVRPDPAYALPPIVRALRATVARHGTVVAVSPYDLAELLDALDQLRTVEQAARDLFEQSGCVWTTCGESRCEAARVRLHEALLAVPPMEEAAHG